MRFTLGAICGVQLKDRKSAKDFMLMLGLNETMDQSFMAKRVHWYGHMRRRVDGHMLRRALEFRVEGEGRNGIGSNA